MMKPKISIIVPVYNVQRYIRECIKSLLNQTIREIEIILVDDGSTDLSGKICDEYAEKDKRVVVIHKENEGLGLTRNTGIAIARGEYVGFVDSDDIVSDKCFELMYENMLNYNADASYCSFCRFQNPEDIKISLENDCNLFSNIRDYLLARVGTEPTAKRDTNFPVSVCGALFRKEIIENNNIVFASERKLISEDLIFDIDYISLCKRIVHSSFVGYYYRCNPQSLTTSYKENRFEKNIFLYLTLQEKLRNLNYSKDEIANSTSRYLLTTSRIAILQTVNYMPLIGYKQVKSTIKNICNNAEFRVVLKQYPYQKLPFRLRVFVYLEKNNMILGLIVLSRVHSMMRKNKRI